MALVTIEVDRPPDEVFAYLDAVDRHGVRSARWGRSMPLARRGAARSLPHDYERLKARLETVP